MVKSHQYKGLKYIIFREVNFPSSIRELALTGEREVTSLK